MENETQTNEVNPAGNQTSSNSAENQAPMSLYDKTEAIVTRQEAANKKTEELLVRQETLHANERLAGTAGGHIEAPKVSEEDKKVQQATEFFKGTQLEKDIAKANE